MKYTHDLNFLKNHLDLMIPVGFQPRARQMPITCREHMVGCVMILSSVLFNRKKRSRNRNIFIETSGNNTNIMMSKQQINCGALFICEF